LFSKDFISAFNIFSISAMSFFSVPNSLFSIKSKFPANNICEVRLYISSFGKFAVIVYISKQSLYDFCQASHESQNCLRSEQKQTFYEFIIL